MSIATRIKDARTQAHLTQLQVATAMRVSAMSPSRWETGANKPRRSQLVALAKVLGTTVEELTQDEDAAAATSRAADILTAVLQAALRSATSENANANDRRRRQVPISVDRRAGDRRAVSA